jgi:hypothetical protein
MAFLCRKQETVDSRKISIDTFFCADRLDTVHGRDLAIIIEPRLIFAAHPDQLGIEIIELGRQMRSGAGRHPAPDFAAINDDDGAAKPAELVGCRESSNTGADDNESHISSLCSGDTSIAGPSSIQQDLLRSSATFMARSLLPKHVIATNLGMFQEG